MKIPKLPEYVEMGPFKVHLKLVSHELAYEVSEQQGSFHSKPPMTIVLDENIMAMENESTLNVLVHELFHLCYYQYELEKVTEEENIVSKEIFADSAFELFSYSLKAVINIATLNAFRLARFITPSSSTSPPFLQYL